MHIPKPKETIQSFDQCLVQVKVVQLNNTHATLQSQFLNLLYPLFLSEAKTYSLILFCNATSLGSGTISEHLYIASTLALGSSSSEYYFLSSLNSQSFFLKENINF